MVEAYPLSWPEGWPRTAPGSRTYSRFDCTQEKAQRGVVEQLRMMQATGVVISTDIPLRKDGLPYARYTIDDPGVAVYFTWKKKQMCIPCDKWRSVAENMRAIEKSIEAMRGLDRWGAKDFVERAFSGFAALPSPDMIPGERDRLWWEVLEVHQEARPAEVKAAHIRLARKYHPDSGTEPSHEAMVAVNRAVAFYESHVAR